MLFLRVVLLDDVVETFDGIRRCPRAICSEDLDADQIGARRDTKEVGSSCARDMCPVAVLIARRVEVAIPFHAEAHGRSTTKCQVVRIDACVDNVDVHPSAKVATTVVLVLELHLRHVSADSALLGDSLQAPRGIRLNLCRKASHAYGLLHVLDSGHRIQGIDAMIVHVPREATEHGVVEGVTDVRMRFVQTKAGEDLRDLRGLWVIRIE